MHKTPVLILFTCSSGRKLKAYDAIEPLDSADSVFWVGLPLSIAGKIWGLHVKFLMVSHFIAQ